LITLIKSIMLIIFTINFYKKLASYSQLTSITKIVNEMQGLSIFYLYSVRGIMVSIAAFQQTVDPGSLPVDRISFLPVVSFRVD